MKSCLIIVDVQNDFLPDGSLPVPEGNKIIPIINKLIPDFDLIIFTQDWHPNDHKSFASQHPDKNVFDSINLNGLNQVLWPDHCIQGTIGADICNDININEIKGDFYIFKKGIDKEVDSYSGFYDNGKKNSTGLAEFLNERNVTRVFICGLAMDFCVKYTAIDAAMEGFDTVVIEDATQPIDQDINNLLKEFQEAGVKLIDSWEISMYNLFN